MVPDNIGDAFDIGDGEATASPDRLAALHRAAKEAAQLEAYIEQLEHDLEAAQGQLNSLKAGRLPDLMNELRMTDFTHEGFRFYIHRYMSGTLPKDPEGSAKAMEWLEANEGSGLFKTTVSVEFGKSGHNRALALAADLRSQDYEVKVVSGVHPQSLLAWVRERLDARPPKPVDVDTLGVFVGRVTKVEPVTDAPKAKAGRKK